MCWLTDEIKEGDDITMHIIKALAFVSLCGVIIFLLVILWSLFFPSPRFDRAQHAIHNEEQFAALRLRHGLKATQVVVYEGNGKAFYYPTGSQGKKMELR